MRIPSPVWALAWAASATWLFASPVASTQKGAWVTTWSSSQTAAYGTEVLPTGAQQNTSLREVVHLSAGGTSLRLRLSNRFGEAPLVLRSVHVARAGAHLPTDQIDPASDQPVHFGGSVSVSIPPGAEFLSDPVTFRAAPLSDLAVTLFWEQAPTTPTLHAGARATSYLLHGDHAAETSLPAASPVTRWYFLSEVEVAGDARNHGTVVAFGDSITDGHGSTTDGNDRWPDLLAQRLHAAPAARFLAVANAGIGGNRLLDNGVGPDALSRFNRDVLSQTGVRTVILLEGINDLGSLDRTAEHPASVHGALVASLEASMLQLITQAHARGLRILGGTLTPFLGSGYYHPSSATEADRQALNTWIRTGGHFDAVVDFDLALRDPAHPDRLLPAADSGDHLHPGPAGYARMADAVPLAALW